MVKYIHKQAAIYALVNEANIHKNPIKRAYTRAAAIIEQIPAEDVQPVIHAAWIETTPNDYMSGLNVQTANIRTLKNLIIVLNVEQKWIAKATKG